MNERYFYLIDLKMVGKIIDEKAYLYQNRAWIIDKNSIIRNRLIGYDTLFKTYHNKHVTKKIKEVTLDQAQHLMNLS